MSIKRGSIYLVDFGHKYQSELGKKRPALVIQTNYVNDNLDVAPYKSILVIPLTTDIKGGRFRHSVSARDRLDKDSELLINWMCTVDLARFIDEEPLTTLTQEELQLLKEKLNFFMGYLD
jgi:mRNA interferase MazF